MQFQSIDKIHTDSFIRPFIIGLSAAVSLVLNGIGLFGGISIVLPHLFYIPIILGAYYYPKRGVLFSAGLALAYFVEVCVIDPAAPEIIAAALVRAIVFVLIAIVIAWISGRMQADNNVCRRLASMVRSSNDAIIGKTLDGTITDWNDGAENLYGYTSGEAVGRAISIIIPENRSAELAALLEKIRRGEVVERYETERKTKDGRIIQVSLSLSPIKDDRGEITGVSASAHDITAETAMRDEILKAKNEWELTFDAVPDLVAIIDNQHRIVRINKAMANMFGREPDEMVGRPCYEIVHCQHKPAELCPHMLLIRDGKPHSQLVHEDRINADFYLTVSPLRDAGGEVIGSVHVLHDITESRKVQKELADRERFLNLLLETISSPIFYKDKNGAYLGCNTSFEKYLGIRKEAIIAKTAYDIAPRELADIYTQKDNELFASPGSQVYESQMRHADGSIHDVIFTKSTFTDRDGRVEGLVGVILDITERKQWETALRQANEKLNMLSSITRHDILNQVMGLRTFLELSQEMATDPDLRHYIGKEMQAAEAIRRQIEFTRYYQDIGVQVPRWHNLEETIRASLSQLNLEKIAVSIDLSPAEIYADPLIEKVFYNLIENSLRHGGGVTRIAIGEMETEEGLVITYTDDGIGISPEDKSRLFRKGFGKNTGLGLFLSREILSITGLSIRESGTPGSGVRFEVIAPTGKYRFL